MRLEYIVPVLIHVVVIVHTGDEVNNMHSPFLTQIISQTAFGHRAESSYIADGGMKRE
jgi:hypothetical protein